MWTVPSYHVFLIEGSAIRLGVVDEIGKKLPPSVMGFAEGRVEWSLPFNKGSIPLVS
jgi:hypothetical protein